MRDATPATALGGAAPAFDASARAGAGAVLWRLRARRLGAAGLLGVLVLAGCRPSPQVAADVVVRVEKDPIEVSRFEAFLHRQVGEGAGGLDSEILSILFDQFVDEELLVRLAVTKGLVAADASRRHAVDALLVGVEEEPISEEEVARYYERHREEFRLPDRVVLFHILVGDEAEANAARERVLGSADFAAVAEEISLDPSAVHGGFQGEVALVDLPFAFAQSIASLEPGEVSEVVRAADGFHLFQVQERMEEEDLPLAMVTEEIEQLLRRQRGDARVAALVREARSHYNVEVFAQNLPFHYQGEYRSTG